VPAGNLGERNLLELFATRIMPELGDRTAAGAR
jgi:hypothetical protein